MCSIIVWINVKLINALFIQVSPSSLLSENKVK